MAKNVVVISGPPGAGSSTISKIVAKKLKLRYFSFGELHKKLHKEGKNKEAKAALEVWKTNVGSSEKTHRERDELHSVISKKGNIVICGKLSIHFLKDETPFKIWINASLDVRANRSSNRDKVSIEEARSHIFERENIEREKWKKMYGFDYFDQKNDADFVIDTSNMTVNETVEKILNFIKSKKDINP